MPFFLFAYSISRFAQITAALLGNRPFSDYDVLKIINLSLPIRCNTTSHWLMPLEKQTFGCCLKVNTLYN